MTINVRIRDGLCPDPATGDGGATEGDIRGSFSDIIGVVGVKDLAGGHALVTQNSPAALSVLVAPGVVYIPNADYDELDSNQVKFWEAVITASTAVAITANTSGSTRIDLICVKMDTAVTPDEHASNIATLVAVAGTPGAGAPATPDNYAKLAEIEVANGASTIVNADITDSRVQSTINSDYITIEVTPTSITTFTGKTFDDELRLKQIATPTNPATGYNKLYFKSNGKLYYLDENSVETEVGAGGGGSIDGWNDASETWEFVSVDDPTGIFRVNADVTGKYSPGMRIKFTNATNVIYGIITVVGAYTGGYTSVTFLHQIDPTDSLALVLMANSAITLNYYSTQKAPQGFPLSPAKWSVELVNTTNPESPIAQNTWSNLGSMNITLPIGVFDVSFSVVGLYSYRNGTSVYAKVTLSTANNSESDADFTLGSGVDGATASLISTAVNGFARKYLSITAKTVYYINFTQTKTGSNYVGCNGRIIRATCAYL